MIGTRDVDPSGGDAPPPLTPPAVGQRPPVQEPPDGHVTPQRPQFLGSEVRTVQVPPQFVCPSKHAAAPGGSGGGGGGEAAGGGFVAEHAPWMQVCLSEHRSPHAPQLPESIDVSMHFEPQFV